MLAPAIATTHPSHGTTTVPRLAPEAGPFPRLAAVRLHVPARSTVRDPVPTDAELLLVGVSGTVEASHPYGMRTVTPGSITTLPSGEGLNLINDGLRGATLLAVLVTAASPSPQQV
ncbi:hypothetical protein [Streptacidiphilus jiangxiensis]|uniref:Cupin domain-containing protein n=1 Tax=Streptacidiphilus jiangxiensis TaxID=235985 RepID=A0A1H7UM27_STRJI|nr:hypothetical protein [Streptacidiphilus jiangxiensis]SEL98142.1 hypothetical protein SAMN05414137_11650 [Streptacidiphilus jiangxiensis]